MNVHTLLDLWPLAAVLACVPVLPAPSAGVTGRCLHRLGTVDFFADSSVPAAAQQAFAATVCQMIETVEAWATAHGWTLPLGLPRLRILVGEHYALSRSLVPGWESDRSRMEFPAPRVNDAKCAVAHELTHFYFPNGNRMLAEGFAVYVHDETQASPGGNPAYPNFGTPVHEAIKHHVAPAVFEQFELARLDAIPTPLILTVDVGDEKYREQFAYIFASSFVRYLIDTYGMDRFRQIYGKTGLEPGRHIRRTSDDWLDVYGSSLSALQKNWKAMIEDVTTSGPPPPLVPR